MKLVDRLKKLVGGRSVGGASPRSAVPFSMGVGASAYPSVPSAASAPLGPSFTQAEEEKLLRETVSWNTGGDLETKIKRDFEAARRRLPKCSVCAAGPSIIR